MLEQRGRGPRGWSWGSQGERELRTERGWVGRVQPCLGLGPELPAVQILDLLFISRAPLSPDRASAIPCLIFLIRPRKPMTGICF